MTQFAALSRTLPGFVRGRRGPLRPTSEPGGVQTHRLESSALRGLFQVQRYLWENSSSAGAGTIFATGILRGASFQTRIGARPGSRTGSLFIQPSGIPGSAGFSRTQVFSKSTSLGTSLATCTFQRQGRFGNGRPWPSGPSGRSDGHAGPLRWPHGASQPR